MPCLKYAGTRVSCNKSTGSRVVATMTTEQDNNTHTHTSQIHVHQNQEREGGKSMFSEEISTSHQISAPQHQKNHMRKHRLRKKNMDCKLSEAEKYWAERSYGPVHWYDVVQHAFPLGQGMSDHKHTIERKTLKRSRLNSQERRKKEENKLLIQLNTSL